MEAARLALLAYQRKKLKQNTELAEFLGRNNSFLFIHHYLGKALNNGFA
jgi:hypothetical protein